MSKNLQELAIEFKTTGSEKAFTELYTRLKPGLQNYIGKIIKYQADVDSVLANTFSIVHEKIHQYNPEWHISTWVYRIAYTTTCMELRIKKKDAFVRFSEMEDSDTIGSVSKIEYDFLGEFKDDLILEEEQRERERKVEHLKSIIRDMPEKFKTVLIDRYYNNLKYEEISIKHHLTLQTVKNRIFKAKNIIKEKLQTENVY